MQSIRLTSNLPDYTMSKKKVLHEGQALRFSQFRSQRGAFLQYCHGKRSNKANKIAEHCQMHKLSGLLKSQKRCRKKQKYPSPKKKGKEEETEQPQN